MKSKVVRIARGQNLNIRQSMQEAIDKHLEEGWRLAFVNISPPSGCTKEIAYLTFLEAEPAPVRVSPFLDFSAEPEPESEPEDEEKGEHVYVPFSALAKAEAQRAAEAKASLERKLGNRLW